MGKKSSDLILGGLPWVQCDLPDSVRERTRETEAR